MTVQAALSLEGRTIGVTADRRSAEQITMFERRGARVVYGSTMETVDLTTDGPLREVTFALIARPPALLIVGTGFGVREWLLAADAWDARGRLLDSLASAGTRIMCRGAKGASAIKQAGLEVAWQGTTESMAEVLEHLPAQLGQLREGAGNAGGLGGTQIAVQLFDPDDHPSTLAIRELAAGVAATVVEVPVYRWRLPSDAGPAHEVIRLVAAGELDAVTFTSQPAVRFLVRLADDIGLRAPLVGAFAADGPTIAVCVGAVCSEAAFEVGFERVVWPSPPRLAPMVRLAEVQLSR